MLRTDHRGILILDPFRPRDYPAEPAWGKIVNDLEWRPKRLLCVPLTPRSVWLEEGLYLSTLWYVCAVFLRMWDALLMSLYNLSGDKIGYIFAM